MYSLEEEIEKENLVETCFSTVKPMATNPCAMNLNQKKLNGGDSDGGAVNALGLTPTTTKRGGGEMFNIPLGNNKNLGVLGKETVLYENRHVVKLPILHLGLFQSPLTVDFRNVIIGQSKTLVVQCSIPAPKKNDHSLELYEGRGDASSTNSTRKMVLSSSTKDNIQRGGGPRSLNLENDVTKANRKVKVSMTKIPKGIRVDVGDITLTKEQKEKEEKIRRKKALPCTSSSSSAIVDFSKLDNVELREGDKISITWSPTEVDGMRKGLHFTLNGKHRLQLNVQGKGILNDEQGKKGNRKAVMKAYQKNGGSIYSSSFGGGGGGNSKSSNGSSNSPSMKQGRNVDPLINQIHQCKVDFNSSLDKKLSSILSGPPPSLPSSISASASPSTLNTKKHREEEDKEKLHQKQQDIEKKETSGGQEIIGNVKVKEDREDGHSRVQKILLPPTPPVSTTVNRKESITAMFIPSEISLDEESMNDKKKLEEKELKINLNSTLCKGGMIVDIDPENSPMMATATTTRITKGATISGGNTSRCPFKHEGSLGSTIMNEGNGSGFSKRSNQKSSTKGNKKITSADIRKKTQETRLTEWLNFTLNPSQLSAYKAVDIPAQPFEHADVCSTTSKCKVDVNTGSISFLDPTLTTPPKSLTPRTSASVSTSASAIKSITNRRASGGVGDVSLSLTQRISHLEIAHAIYWGEEFQTILSQLENEVKQDMKIKIRDDKDVYADLELRANFIDMLMSYERIWLILALETIFPEIEIRKMRKIAKDGHILCLSTDQVLRKVLTERVLKDPVITKKYFHHSKVKVLSGKFQTAYRKELGAHTICKFLQIVLLLDQCKLSNEIMPYRKSLFRSNGSSTTDGKSSISSMKNIWNKFNVKSSETLINLFARDFLFGEGNIIRHLSHACGYEVFFEQHLTDEFNYRVTNLATDLRDGIRLAKLTDILSGIALGSSVATPSASDSNNKYGGELCYKLRLPCDSRMRKMYNVELVLQRQAEFGVIRKSVCSKDIVDGNREKTLELLWGIIGHFNLNLLVESLTGLLRFQATVRAYILRKRFLLAKNLASSLQRLYRHKKKMTFQFNKAPVKKSIIHLQQSWRMKRAQRLFAIHEKNAIIIQTHIRSLLARKYVAFLVAERENYLLQIQKSIIIQSRLRSTFAWKRYRRFRNAVIFLQATQKAKKETYIYQKERKKILLLQAQVRMFLARKNRRVCLAACIILQAFGRQCLYLKRYHRFRNAVIFLQATQKAKKETYLYQKERKKVLLLQAQVRMFLARKNLRVSLAACIILQAFGRRCLHRMNYCYTRMMIISLQRRVRTKKLQRQARNAIAKVKLIQAQIRMYQAKQKFTQSKTAIIKLQAFSRMQLMREKYCESRRKIIYLQSKVRSIQQRQVYKSMISIIILMQSQIRRFLTQKKFWMAVKKVTIIQSLVRKYRVKLELSRKNQAAGCIQSQWKYCLRLKHQSLLQAKMATKIQAIVRSWRTRKLYLIKYHHIISLQSLFRGFSTRKAKTILRDHTIQIQSWWRMCKAKKSYKILIDTVIFGVIRFQACVRGVQGRQQFIEEYFAARKIQSMVRMHLCRNLYLTTYQKIVKLQASARMYIEKRKVDHLLMVVLYLQQLFREKRRIRQFKKVEKQVVLVQSLIRVFLVQKRLHQRKEAQVILYRWITAFLIRRRYQKIRCTALIIQSLYRAQRVRKERSKKLSAIACQLKQANDKARADPSLLIGNRNKAALNILINSTSCALILHSCATLDISTRLSQSCCEALCQVGGVEILFNLIRTCNRSKPHMELVCHALRVIQNLCLHDHLLPYIISNVNQTELETKNQKTSSKKLLEVIVANNKISSSSTSSLTLSSPTRTPCAPAPELDCSEKDILMFSETMVGIMVSYREKRDLFFPAAMILSKFSAVYPEVKASLKNLEIERKLTGLCNIFSRSSSSNASFNPHLYVSSSTSKANLSLNSSFKSNGRSVGGVGKGSTKAAAKVYGYKGSSGMPQKENSNTNNYPKGLNKSSKTSNLTPLMLLKMLMQGH